MLTDAEWTPADSDAASAEGWDLFDEGRSYGIERIDDAQAFPGDDEAIEHVQRRAADGCPIAAKALAMHGMDIPADDNTRSNGPHQ